MERQQITRQIGQGKCYLCNGTFNKTYFQKVVGLGYSCANRVSREVQYGAFYASGLNPIEALHSE
jgi:hypothetical protein